MQELRAKRQRRKREKEFFAQRQGEKEMRKCLMEDVDVQMYHLFGG
jgi:hypothetical protein